MTHSKFIPSQFLNIRTEKWEDIDKMYQGENFLENQCFVKIIPVLDNIYMIVWDNYDCSTSKELYKGILE